VKNRGHVSEPLENIVVRSVRTDLRRIDLPALALTNQFYHHFKILSCDSADCSANRQESSATLN
jgi:hypothetical protein